MRHVHYLKAGDKLKFLYCFSSRTSLISAFEAGTVLLVGTLIMFRAGFGAQPPITAPMTRHLPSTKIAYFLYSNESNLMALWQVS